MELNLSPLFKVEDIPVAPSVRCFYVNLPDTDIASVKVVLLEELERYYDDTPALKADIEKVGEGTYKLTVPGLSSKKGIAALKVDSPAGTPRGLLGLTPYRFYLLRLQ
jgi:hypothetical protein